MNLSTTNETINDSYQNQNQNINMCSNTKPQLSISPNTLNSNPFILPKTDGLNYSSLSSPKSGNLKLKLIEKDKIIFDYMKKEKEYLRAIDDVKSSLKEKEDEIAKLKQEIKEMEFKFSNKENLLNLQNEEYSMITDEKRNMISNLQKENNELKNDIFKFNNIIKAFECDKKNMYEEHQKNGSKISELINQISKNEKILKMFKKNEDNLKEENKQIPSLKRKIADLENMLMDYQNKVNELKKHNDKANNDKEELNNIINQKKEEIQKEKVNEQYVIRLNYKIDYLSNELNSKNIENENINNKYSIMRKDIDTFVNIFLKELNNYLNYLEGLNIFSKTLHKLPVCTFPNFENVNISQDFRVKYEILGEVIYQIKEKIIDILNKNIEKNQNILCDYLNKENKYKLLLEEKDKLLQNKDDKENAIICANDQIQKYKADIQKFNNQYSKLKTEILELKNTNKECILKNKVLIQNYNDFISDIPNQLKDFPYKEKNKKNKNKNKNKNDDLDDIKNEIISQIDSLIILNKELNNQIKYLEDQNKNIKNDLDLTIRDNNSLKSELNNNNKEISNKLDVIKDTNEKEFLNQKKILYDKISTLNNLLEESNQIIKAYEIEVTDLKNKNLKLENNLKLLTNSHHELEKIINTSTSGLKSEIDIKDQKYNDLLKELQLKDIHIKSLERLIDQRNKPVPGKIFTKTNFIPVNIGDDDNNNSQNGFNATFNNNKINNQEQSFASFGRDEVNEMKLNKLIKGFEIQNKINNFNNISNNQNQNDNEFKLELKDLIKQSDDGNDLLNQNIDEQNYIINNDDNNK